jgi:F0F1-type ATP synthase membrane subunit b/b'
MEILPEVGPSIALTLPFLVTFVALNFILFKPLLAYLEERNVASVGAREEALEKSTLADQRLISIEEKLLEARKANTAMRQAARAEAQSEESALIAVARADADAKVKLAVADIQGAAEAASKALSVSAQALSSEIAGQVLGRQAQGEA